MEYAQHRLLQCRRHARWESDEDHRKPYQAMLIRQRRVHASLATWRHGSLVRERAWQLVHLLRLLWERIRLSLHQLRRQLSCHSEQLDELYSESTDQELQLAIHRWALKLWANRVELHWALRARARPLRQHLLDPWWDQFRRCLWYLCWYKHPLVEVPCGP